MARICVITDIFPHEEHKSAGIFVRDHVEILSAEYDVEVVVIRSKRSFSNKPRTYLRDNLPESVIINEISYLSFPRNYAPNIVFPLLFKRLNSRFDLNKFDLFYVHNILPGGGLIPLLKNHYPKIPCIQMVHGSDWRDKWARYYLRKNLIETLYLADAIWVSGPELAKEILTALPEVKSKLEITYNIIASKIFSVKNLDKTIARDILGWSNNSIQLLCIANIAHVKGVDILVEALSNLDTHSWDHLHILGGVSDKKLAQLIKKRVLELGLNNKVIFAGTKERQELINYYYASDLYILPSRNEGFNVSLLEASYIGIPAVATKCGGATLLIKDEKYIPKTGSTRELTKSISLLLNNLDKYTKENYFNTSFIQKYCSPDSLIHRFNKIL